MGLVPKWLRTYKHRMDAPLRKALHRTVTTASSKASPSIPVIIQFRTKHAKHQMNCLARCLGSCKRASLRKLPIINAMAVRAPLSGLRNLCRAKEVSQIYLNRKVRVNLNIATPSVGSRSLQRTGVTGRGVTIAVLDTGVYRHPDLRGRIIGFKDFVNGRTGSYDDNGHGTHVAGCAAGNGSRSSRNRMFIGAAPRARIVGVKVLDRKGEGTLDQVIAGISWCVRNRKRFGIRVLNMSLGAPATDSWRRDPLCQAIGRAARAGIVPVIAAGNAGPRARSIDSPGISPAAITVGASNDRKTIKQSDDTVARFSSRGPTIDGLVKPDLVAPGVSITSLRAPGSFLDRSEQTRRVGRWYFTLSGTSMATPIVSGIVAQLLQRRPSLSPSQIKALLKSRAVNLGLPRNTQGRGEINARFIRS
jgi:serine protease AprX